MNDEQFINQIEIVYKQFKDEEQSLQVRSGFDSLGHNINHFFKKNGKLDRPELSDPDDITPSEYDEYVTTLLDKYIELCPASVVGYELKTHQYFGFGYQYDTEEPLEPLSKCIEILPDVADYRWYRLSLKYRKSFEGYGVFDVEDLNKIIELDPGNILVYKLLGMQGNDYDTAISAWSKLIDIFPGHPYPYIQRGERIIDQERKKGLDYYKGSYVVGFETTIETEIEKRIKRTTDFQPLKDFCKAVELVKIGYAEIEYPKFRFYGVAEGLLDEYEDSFYYYNWNESEPEGMAHSDYEEYRYKEITEIFHGRTTDILVCNSCVRVVKTEDVVEDEVAGTKMVSCENCVVMRCGNYWDEDGNIYIEYNHYANSWQTCGREKSWVFLNMCRCGTYVCLECLVLCEKCKVSRCKACYIYCEGSEDKKCKTRR